MSAPEKKPPASGRGANAARNTATAGVAGAQGAAAAAHAVTLPATTAASVQSRAIAQATAKLVEALAKFAQGRSQTIIPMLTTSLQEQFVDRTPIEIAKLVGREQAREREFLHRQRVRMARDLPGVLRESDEAKRKRALDKLLARERHYMRLREQAMTARAHSAVASLDLQEASPQGAMWMLSSDVANHTPGCVAMAGRFWPWVVLREVMHPPVHPGCPCYLITLDEAVARGLMRPEDIPDTKDALLRARANMALEEALLDEFGEDAILEAMLTLGEVRHAPDRPTYKARRYAKGFEKGGQFMPKLGGSPGAAIRALMPHIHAHPAARSASRKRGVWMKGQHVSVPEDRQFSRKIGGSHFTSPPGSTNVYRDGHLVSTPDAPSLHPDTRRPRGDAKRGSVTSKKKGLTVGTAVEDRRKAQARKVERALRAADAGTSPVSVGDTAEHAHSELKVGGFKADEAKARQTADSLTVPYSHPDGHTLDVTINRVSGKVTEVNWKPGAAPSDTSKLRSKLGLDKPKAPDKPSAPRPTERKTRDERAALAHADHESILQRTLGTHDAVWQRQVERAKSNDADAQWDLATEAGARGPNSDFTTRLKAEVGAAALAKWQRESAPRPLPGDKPSRHYEVKHVAASDHGPTVGVGVHAGTAGGRGDGSRQMGTGHYFTGRPVAGSATHGVDLQGSRLMRPRDEQQSRGVAHALSVLNGIAEGGGSSVRMPDPRTGEMRVFGVEDALSGIPHGRNEFDARLMAEHAIDQHRHGAADETAATHMMRAIGFDGVDNRHIPSLDVPSFGSVVYEPEHVSTAMPAPAETAGRSQSGSVVRGVLGRWVWIRGRNKHVPHEAAWSKEFDGITYSSPAGSTDVFKHEPDGSQTLISRVGMPQTHPDSRNPRLSGQRRGGRTRDGQADPQPPPAPPPAPAPAPAPAPEPVAPPPDPGPPPMPRPTVGQGEHVRGSLIHGDTQFDGHVEGVNQMSDGRWGVVVRVSSGPQQGRLITLAGHTVGPLPQDAPPEGVGLNLTPAQRDALIAGSVADVQVSMSQVEALNASGLAEGQLTVGPLWQRMNPAERQFALDHAYGRAMAHALAQDDTARGDLSNLWTSGAFSGPDGVPLDRYSPEAGVAIAHARMNGENWREFAQAHPDLSRWVAAQAEQRHHAIRPDVLEFIHNTEDNGNVHDSVGPLSNEARSLAQSLVGRSYIEANGVLARENGYSLVQGRTDDRSAFRRINSAGHVETIVLTTANGQVTGADGTAYSFDGNAEPPPGDTPERHAYEMRGLDAGGPLASAMEQRGYVALRTNFAGEHSRTVWVRHDSGVGMMVQSARGPAPGGDFPADVRPVMLDPGEYRARMSVFVDANPEKAFPQGTSLEDVNATLSGSAWKVTPSADGRFLNLTKTGNLDNPDTAFVDVRKIALQGPDGARVVETVGRPGLSNISGLAVDDADAQAFVEAANSGMRQSARERRDRIDALKERLRTEVNAGRMPFAADDQMPDIVEALQESGFRKASERAWQDTGRSVTWKNRATGAQIITRSKPNPEAPTASRWRTRLGERDAGGVPTNIYVSGRLSDPGVRDEGRNRSPEGAPPADIPAWTGEILGWSDELGARYGTEVFNTGVRFAPASADARVDRDHAGFHETNTGRINVGREVKPALETLARARAEGRPLTPQEMRTIHQSYRTIQHEILHGVAVNGSLSPRDGSRHGYDFADGGQGIEESLTEELAGQLTVELMRRHGLEDVIAHAQANPDAHWSGYHTHRAHFDTLLTRMGLHTPEARREAMEHWKFRMNHLQRREDMAARISAHEGIPTDQGRMAVRSVMGVATKSSGSVPVPDLRPVLPVDYSRPEGVPEPPPPEPPAASQYQVGQRVVFTRGAGVHEGVIEQSVDTSDAHAARGWQHLIRPDSGASVWVGEADIRRGLPGPPPEPPPPPPSPPVPRGVTTTISDGGVISVGAMVRGSHSGQLGQVQTIDGANITVRREDGSVGTFDGHSWRSVIVTDGGAVLDHGATVTGPGGVTGRITEIDWSDPQNPQAKLTPLSGPEQTVQGRNLTGAGAGGFNLPLTTRDGTARPANIGDNIRMRDGRTGKLMGSQLDSWPSGTPAYQVQIDGTGVVELVPREGIIGYANELPRIDQVSGNFTPEQLQALQETHFNRADGGALARPMGEALAGARSGLTSNIADGFATWATANGITLPGSPSAVMAEYYTAGFKDQASFDALNPVIRDAVYQLAQEAGLPTPDWVTQRPILPAGIPHGDITDEAVVRAIFQGSFGREGHTVDLQHVEASGNSTSARGVIRDASGSAIGTFTRRITRNTDGSFAVYNAYLQLSATAQGSGFASAFNKHCFDIYAAKGVREVTVSANIDVGAYTWAATGFDFQAQGTPLVKAEQRARQAYMLADQARGRGRISEEEWAAIRPRLWDGRSDGPLRQDHVQHAWELAYIDGRPSGRGRTKNIGQKMLLGSDVSWSGIRLLGAPPAPREGEAAQGPIPQGRPGGDSVPIVVPEGPKKLTARKAQDWLRHNIAEMTLPFRNGVREVATVQSAVHPNVRPSVAPSVEVGRTIEVDGIRPAGQYVSDRHEIRLDSELSMENRELILAQQYGNHLYDTVIERQMQRASENFDTSVPGYHTGYTQWRALADEMAASRMATRTRRRLDQGAIDQAMYDRLTSERALFAKAYAGWLTARSRNPRMLRQQRRALRADYGGVRNFDAREHQAFAPLMDALFEALGASGTDTPRVPGLAAR